MENRKKKPGGCTGCIVMMLVAPVIGMLCMMSAMTTVMTTTFAGVSVVATHQKGSPTPVPTGTGTITCSGTCKGKYGFAIAKDAQIIANHLFGIPDVFYDSGMPGTALDYWNSVCPINSFCYLDWVEGNLQCVFLVTGAFALAGHPLPVAHNAIQFWPDYANQPGFEEIPARDGGMPAVGDIMVFDDSPLGGVGHVAIVTGVTLPSKGHTGIIRWAQANSFQNFAQATINLDGTITLDGWLGYTVVGYIRTV